MSARAHTASKRSTAILTLATLATVGPTLVELVLAPQRVYSYLAADAFYYLTIGRNLVRFGFPTFDHERATNGFHPLWQGVVAALATVFDDGALPLVAVLVCAALVGGAVYGLGRVLERAYGRLPALYAAVPLGVLPLFMIPFWLTVGDGLPEMNPYEGSAPLWCTLWMYQNGMETPLALALWVAVGALFVMRPVLESPRWGALLGVTLGALCLARLDLALFVAPLGLVILRARPTPAALGAIALGGLLALVPYLASNEVYFGALVPVSGRLKSTFPHASAHHNFGVLSALLLAPDDWWLEKASRVIQLMVPPLFALHALARLRPRWRREASSAPAAFDAFLQASAVGVILLALYDGLYVPSGAQGHWYFPLSTIFVSAYVLRGLARRPAPRSAALTYGLAGAAAIGALLAFLTFHRHEDHHASYRRFCEQHAAPIREQFGADTPLVEFDDGVVAFCTGMPTIPAAGLGTDPAAAERIAAGQLFPLAVERGHVLLTSAIISARVYAGATHGWPGGARIVYGSYEEGVVVVELQNTERSAPAR